MEIIEDGRSFLKPQGGRQWQDGFRDAETLRNDLSLGHLYAILSSNGDIASIAVFTYFEKDYETPPYQGG